MCPPLARSSPKQRLALCISFLCLIGLVAATLYLIGVAGRKSLLTPEELRLIDRMQWSSKKSSPTLSPP